MKAQVDGVLSALTATCSHPSPHPLGSSGECTLAVKRKLADWTGNFLFDSECLFSWTRLTCFDLSPWARRSASRSPALHPQPASNKTHSLHGPVTHTHTQTKGINQSLPLILKIVCKSAELYLEKKQDVVAASSPEI